MTDPPKLPTHCQICGALLGKGPIWIAPAPSGGVWAIHLEQRDCVAALVAKHKEERRVAA